MPVAPVSGLAVRRLTLTDFRCYHRMRLDNDGRPVVLTGPNGAGKTNMLEALSFLAPGRGLRRAKLVDIRRRDGDVAASWAVAAHLDGPLGSVDIGTGQDRGTERRVVRLDGQPARAQDLAPLLSVLWLTPAMDRLFTEGAGGRRRFLDRLVLGQFPTHGRHSAAYEHAMRERSRLLRQGGADPAWLTALEEGMAQHGIAMAVARRQVVQGLHVACGQGVGPFPSAGLALVGTVEQWLADQPPDQAEQRLRNLLRQNRPQDEAAGGATIGPHRSDLEVRHADKDLPAGQCSTGEQKAVLVSIILAQARIRRQQSGIAPLLLLDEVVAHLDQVRRTALFDELAGLNAQSWMTGTDRVLFAEFGERAQFFRVQDACIQPETKAE